MALIGSIRKRGGLLVAAIGVAMLSFILGDLFQSGGSFWKGQPDFGEIAGEVIDVRDFEARVEAEIEMFKQNQKTLTVDNATKELIRERVWNQQLNDIILGNEYNNLNLSITSDELFDMVQGNSPHPLTQQYFTDPKTGVFDRNLVVNYLQNMENDATGVARSQWLIFEKELKNTVMREKYFNLAKKGLYTTTVEAKADYVNKNKKVTFSYVVKKYADVADSLVQVTDKDIKNYYEKHEDEPQYQQETTRSIEYVSFDVLPSTGDTAEAIEWVNKLYTEFEETPNDSLFVLRNSDEAKPPTYYHAGSFPATIDSMVFAVDSGMYGPYFEEGYYKTAKVLGHKYLSDSVKARHILIKFADGDTAKALAKADSLKKIIQKNTPFEIVAMQTSEDLGSAQDGGNLGWFAHGAMVKVFNDACFDGKVGDMPIVTSQFGVHLIEITEKSEEVKQAKVAIVNYQIKASKETYDGVYELANKFSYNDTPEKFAAAIEKEGLSKRVADFIKEDDKTIAGLDDARTIIRWIYKEEKGTISPPFELDDKYVIAHLYEIREKGITPLELVEEGIRNEVLLEKKAEYIIPLMQGNTNLDDLANKLQLSVDKAENVIFASYSIPGVGAEKELLGNIFSLKQGDVSVPIKGKIGVYVVAIDNIIEVTEIPDVSINKNMLIRNNVARVDYELFNTLKEKANITDNRAKYY